MAAGEPFSTSVDVDPDPEENNGMIFEDETPVWKVSSVRTSRSVKFYSCCPDEPWPVLKLIIHLRRNNSDIVYGIYLPIFISVMIGFLAFFLPVSSGERFGVGTTSLLTVFAIMFISKEGDPTVGAVSLQSVYYFSAIWNSVLPILATTVIFKMSSTNAEDKRDVAFWERCLATLFDHCSERQQEEECARAFAGEPEAAGKGAERCPSTPRSDVSIRRVWVMGRRKSIEVERVSSNGSTASSASGSINIVSSVFEQGESALGTRHRTRIPTFGDSLLRNVNAVVRLHETIS